MTKKKKKGKQAEAKRGDAVAAPVNGAHAAGDDSPADGDAVEEFSGDLATRFRDDAALPDAASAAAELDEDLPTRSGGAAVLDDAAAAAAELSDEESARTGVHSVLVPLQPATGLDGDTLELERVSEDHRFDFGGEAHKARVEPGLEEPPDPGSADAASPRLQSIVESLLFAADRPLSLRQLADLVEEPEIERVRAAVLATEQGWRDRGVQLHEVAGGYQFRTHPENAVWVQRLLQQKPVRLSRQLLETLAIVSYRQPITRPEIDEIRGVDSGGTLKTLMDRALVRILGKREEVGRPLIYGTTKEFLEFFSLRDLKDLPTLREYHELSEEHRAQVAALEGAAPEGAILAEGEVEEDELPDAMPRLARLEIAAPREDAAELAEIDRLIRTAGVATDSDLPAGARAAEEEGAADAGDAVTEERSALVEADELAITGRFDAQPRTTEPEGEAVREFDEERARTGTFGDPLRVPDVRPQASDFEEDEATSIRAGDLEASLVDGRDPEKEPTP